MVCAYSLCCNIAIHARWIASESNPADAPSRQRWIDAHTTCAPGEKRPATKSRITTAQACLDTAITTRSARSERGGRSPLEDNGAPELHDHGALKGWKKLTPSYARLPPNCRVDGHCVGLLLQATDLVPPQTSVDAWLRHWELLLCPTERAVPSKTLAFDLSVILDSPWPLRGSTRGTSSRRTSLSRLSTSLPTARTFHSVAQRVNVAESFSLRRGGAPHDALTGHRNLAHIKQSLPALFARPTLTPAPPNVGLGSPHANNVRKAWWARRRTAALHVPLTDLSKTVLATQTNIVRLACAHHVPLIIISPWKICHIMRASSSSFWFERPSFWG